MCYDISFTVSIAKISDYFPELIFDAQFSIDFDKGVHILGHAYGEHPVIYMHRQEEKLHINLMEWGCIPYYVKDEKSFAKQRASMLNAKSERILTDTKSYWNKIKDRRCLIAVTGFYEHREVKGVKNKVPYFISLKDQPLFFLPGLYSVVKFADTETGEITERWTYSIITRDANSVMQQIHNGGSNPGRMPLMLPFELSKKWVNNNLSAEDYKALLAYEMPSEALDFKTVFTIRSAKLREDNKPKNEFYHWDKVPDILL